MVSKYKKIIHLLENNDKTKQRNFKIYYSKLFPKVLSIYNGRKYIPIKFLENNDLMHYTLGSFSLTRSVGKIHEKKKKQKKTKKK